MCGTPKFSTVRQLNDVAEGLNYLHSRNVIYGSITGVRASGLTVHK